MNVNNDWFAFFHNAGPTVSDSATGFKNTYKQK